MHSVSVINGQQKGKMIAPLRKEPGKIIDDDCSGKVVKQVKCSKVLSDSLIIFNVSAGIECTELSINQL